MNRAMDDEIITAFFGTAKTGVDGSTTTTFPAPAGLGLGRRLAPPPA
jgi:hypothetical protein